MKRARKIRRRPAQTLAAVPVAFTALSAPAPTGTIVVDETLQDDPALAALRQVADRTTVHSIKETILACLLIRAVRHSKTPRLRTVIAVTLSMGFAITRYWHTLSTLIHFPH